ncbi:MAG: ABC transporter permease [Oscillospiraceae bacterium]|nr:ABC transporter permease [Oscillospiraceae bacterium]
MYFKMLKHDLTRKKGLNIILFLFMTFASLLVFVGAVQIISNLTHRKTAETLCRTSDMLLVPGQNNLTIEEQEQALERLLAPDENVIDWSTEKMLRIGSAAMDYPDHDEKEKPVYTYKYQFLSAMPKEHDLVYDLADQPFYVPNGSIAIPVSVSALTGTGIGDTIRYTSPYGNTYELTVSTIFKDNALPLTIRFIVSDADYAVLAADAVRSPAMFCIRMQSSSYDDIDSLLRSIEDEVDAYVLADAFSVSDDDVMMKIISVFIVIISVFLILIILMTIRFTMIAELKEEEKEIGMMKALGVDSLSFRWMFAARYTAFAIIGGIIGIAAGIPLSGIVIGTFGPNAILPERWEMYLTGFLCVAGIIAVMILFSLLVMRRIQKISVIEALHGENRGERFSGNAPIFLHRRKKMSVPMFLALSDLLGRLKRYLFLIIAYTLGTVIMLLPYNARNSVITPSYAKVWLYQSYDFQLNLTKEQRDELYKICEKTGKDTYTILNEQIAEAGIPAHIDTCCYGDGYVMLNDNRKAFDVFWKESFAEQITYQKGGRVPTNENEAAMSAFTANRYGIVPGMKVKAIINEQNADRTYPEEHERELTITALYDKMETGMPSLILWDGYKDGYSYTEKETGFVIDAPESEHPAVIAQLRDLYGAAQVYDAQEAIERDLSDFDSLFKTLKLVVSIAVFFILSLITYLYENVFLSEEVPEIALLKSTGFRNSAIRRWHLLRMLCITLISVVLGEIIFWTCGTPFFRFFMRQYEVTGMRFLFEFPVSFLVIPAAVILTVLLVTGLTLTKIRRIDIRRINEE